MLINSNFWFNWRKFTGVKSFFRLQTILFCDNIHRCFGHTFNSIFVLSYVHDWNTRNFADPSLQILIARSHDVATMLRYALYEAVVGVSTFMHARKSLNTRVFGNSNLDQVRNTWSRSEFKWPKMPNTFARTYFNATLNFDPNFSNSAITQSVM